MNKVKLILDALQEHYARERAMPSFAAIARGVGMSVSTIAAAVGELKALDFLRSSQTGRLQPGKRFFERQLVSEVRAGLPAPAEETLPEGLLIDEYLVDAPSKTFLLTVKGESMVDAALLPGDVVVVQRRARPSAGDVVVALVDGEFTLKELAIGEGGEPYLKARNPAYPDIIPADGFEAYGVVVGQFRRYNQAGTRSQTSSKSAGFSTSVNFENSPAKSLNTPEIFDKEAPRARFRHIRKVEAIHLLQPRK